MPGTAGYDEDAETLATAYEDLDFAQVHAPVLHLLPAAPARVLDIGAGSGRDAAALALRGHAVTAVEPAAALRTLGMRLHAAQSIEWIDDHLPGLVALGTPQRRFDLLLLSGVWMHLAPEERDAAMPKVAALLDVGGCVVLTLRHGPVPPGRRMFDVTGDETVALAARWGLGCVHRSERPGQFGQAGVHWTVLALARTHLPAAAA